MTFYLGWGWLTSGYVGDTNDSADGQVVVEGGSGSQGCHIQCCSYRW